MDPVTEKSVPNVCLQCRRRARFWSAMAWAYVTLVAAVYLMIRVWAERWWPATVIMFGPRWVWGAPLVLLVPEVLLAGKAARRARWVVLAGFVIWFGPLMGLCIPWDRTRSVPSGSSLRILTCNFHEHFVDDKAFAHLVNDVQPDLIVMQEYLERHPTFLRGERRAYIATDGELRIESRWPLKKIGEPVNTHAASMGIAVTYEIRTPSGPVPLIAVHLASPHDALSDAMRFDGVSGQILQANSDSRRQQAEEVAKAVRSAGQNAIVVGDFNLPGDSSIFRQHFSGMRDAFETGGFGFGWTYRANGTLSRIDHILTGTGWQCGRCWTAPDVGSPHRPLIADLQTVK